MPEPEDPVADPLDAVQQSDQGLASIPPLIRHFQIESFKERPVQATLVSLLLLPRENERWTSCVLVHGMGGTSSSLQGVQLEVHAAGLLASTRFGRTPTLGSRMADCV